MVIEASPTLSKYKNTMGQCIKLYYPDISDQDLNDIIDYSINKRYKPEEASLNNSYMKKEGKGDLLYFADYIAKREPITTAYGTMFKKHADEPNPLAIVVNDFLEQRNIHKKIMYKYPKGSEDFEKYNLLQSLTYKVQGPFIGDDECKTILIAGKL